MTNNKNDDLENFDDSQYSDLESDLDASFDDPLPDDFSEEIGMDDELTQDEEFASDDNWDDQAVEANDEPKEKKKSSLLTYAVIGAVVIGGGIIALTQLGGDEPPSPQSQELAASPDPALTSLEGLRDEAAKRDAMQPIEEATAAPPPEPQQGFMNETPSLPPGPALTAVDVAPEVSPPAESLPPVPEVPVAESPADPAVIAGLKPLSDFPSVEQIKKADVTPSLEAPPVLQPVEASASVNSAELTVMQGKLDAAQTKIEALEKELEAAKSVIIPSADSGEAVIAELEEKVASLEKKLADKDSELTKAKKADEEQAVPVAVSVPKETPASPRAEEPTVSEPRPAPAAVATVKQVVVWELRGAQPGKALLSRKGTGDDIRTVSVGDSIPGLGRVVSIDQTSAGWVVKGTQGLVTQ